VYVKKWLASICLLIYVGYVASATVLNSNSGEPATTLGVAKQSFEQLSKNTVNVHHHVAPSHSNQGTILHPFVSTGTFTPLAPGDELAWSFASAGNFIAPAIPLFLKNRVLRL